MLKKEIIKNAVVIFFILAIAVISTNRIYYKFQNNREIDFNSDSLDVVFHDKSGNKINITKVTPVTDSVGLSSKNYSFTIKNNLTVGVPYQVKVVLDKDKILEDECGDSSIPLDDIRISIKIGKSQNMIYNLSELEDDILWEDELGALEKEDISIRCWINIDSNVPGGTKLHYHGIIQVIEDFSLIDMD